MNDNYLTITSLIGIPAPCRIFRFFQMIFHFPSDSNLQKSEHFRHLGFKYSKSLLAFKSFGLMVIPHIEVETKWVCAN